MNLKRIIMILIGLVILIAAFWGLSTVSNVTGNAITGTAIQGPTIEQESFKIDEVNSQGAKDDTQDISGQS